MEQDPRCVSIKKGLILCEKRGRFAIMPPDEIVEEERL
jgi:hypothetical protein